MVSDIKRKTKRLRNRTNYFDPDTDKTHVSFSSPDSFFAKSSKIQGYLSRIYYEFKSCLEDNGQAFFYTLTYNDAHVPRYRDIVCFDYNDLVYLLNGGFKKQLERKFGTSLKYFVGAELGEGAGKRGIDNNPHYHIIFFLRPKYNSKVPYIKISPRQFRTLVKKYWQGFDENITGYQDYNTCKFGIAKEGDNLGLVTDFRACAYCAKYVTKDASLVKYCKYLNRELALELSEDFCKSPDLLVSFLYDVIYPKYNIPENCVLDNLSKVIWKFDYKELYFNCCPEHSVRLLQTMDSSHITPFLVSHGFISECGLMQEFKDYCDSKLQEHINKIISEFRNRYSNKCRISQGVGISALNEIDVNNPLVKLPDSSGWKFKPICLYYYRKLFTDIVKDENGNNIRVLNERGVNFKVVQLPKKIDTLSNKVFALASILDESLFNDLKSSRLNTAVSFNYSLVSDIILNRDLLKEKSNLYSIYKLIYDERFFKIHSFGCNPITGFPDLDYIVDYKRFISPSYFQVDYSPCRLSYFLDSSHKDYLPYWAHPLFYENINIFRLFDLLLCSFSVYRDKQAQEAFETEKHLRKFHGREKLITYFKNFKSYV